MNQYKPKFTGPGLRQIIKELEEKNKIDVYKPVTINKFNEWIKDQILNRMEFFKNKNNESI